VDLVRDLRVGGTYWATQPRLPDKYLLIRCEHAVDACRRLGAQHQWVIWQRGDGLTEPGLGTVVVGDCDPWHMLSSAEAVVLEPDDELRVIAAILGVPRYLCEGPSAPLQRDDADPASLLSSVLCDVAFENPFTGESMSARDAIELCGFWRALIDSNRDISGGLGFAFWKQAHVAPLLWGGSEPFRFLRDGREAKPGKPVAAWRSKTSPEVVNELERAGIAVIEVEDGFLRSQGLGADCVPPLSITVDRLGAYFDSSGPSELELLLQDGKFDTGLLARARRLRQLIVEFGLGKYERGGEAVTIRRHSNLQHILVPGQVEDDRAVQSGGCGLVSNLDLLARVRAQAPDAYILYKPHPDVIAGHRRGAISNRKCMQYADEIVSDLSISSLLSAVDEVHVNTSLTGFEALLREKPVTTYGVPFYAGWGLTTDLGPVPTRRTARRSLDELVAATLLLYPRYLDPVTGLPCPAEVIVDRLSHGAGGEIGLLVTMRRLQGRLMRGFRSLTQ
jgi:capsular polysaccharide export protein